MDKEEDLSEKSPDEIRRKIEETRADLAERLETLEHEVTDTVSGAANAVVDTVHTVKNTVDGTVRALGQKVDGTVDSVKQTLNLRRQVERHPWSMVSGSIALGYLAGSVLPTTMRLTQAAISRRHVSTRSYFEPELALPEVDHYRETDRFLDNEPEEVATESRESSVWTNLAQQFAPEIAQVRQVAIGGLVGLLAEQVKKSLPDNLSVQVGGIIDSVTGKLAGKTAPGPAFAGSEGRRATQPNGVR
jgi:hypothetical protein